jgi:predicted DNA-binding transcriptional regulator AlpA
MTLTEHIALGSRLTFIEWCEVVGLKATLTDQDRVLTMAQWAEAASISPRTARELVASGKGPKVVQLSDNRVGVRLCDHRKWLAERTRKQAWAGQ